MGRLVPGRIVFNAELAVPADHLYDLAAIWGLASDRDATFRHDPDTRSFEVRVGGEVLGHVPPRAYAMFDRVLAEPDLWHATASIVFGGVDDPPTLRVCAERIR